MQSTPTYWQRIWKQFCQHRMGVAGLIVLLLFFIMGIYAPFFASSKPILVEYQGHFYFPLFRYLFYPKFYTKHLDIFYNLLIFTFPLFVISWIAFRNFRPLRLMILGTILLLHCTLFLYLIIFPTKNPAINLAAHLEEQRQLQEQLKVLQNSPFFASSVKPNWNQELQSLNSYAQLNMIMRDKLQQKQHLKMEKYEEEYQKLVKRRGQSEIVFPTLWNLNAQQEKDDLEHQHAIIQQYKNEYPQSKLLLSSIKKGCQISNESFLASLPPWILCDFLNKLSHQDRQAFVKAKNNVDHYEKAKAELNYIMARRDWLDQQSKKLKILITPLLRPYHWEDDAGGDQSLNSFVNWSDLTRINRKDMFSSLIFGIRISLSVGILAIGIALLIGIPIGAFAGYYGGRFDLIIYRFIEIWESMPTFFMLLMIVAFLQSKSIFLIIIVIGLFGWTHFSRFVRGEFLRQKQLLYVEACHALGYSDRKIIFFHLLPNAIPPLLTLIPFAIMRAITSEAGLSFLGLGEEGSNSWGVLMDEGRSAFPSESYLLWPPALLLTLLLVSIALVGDSLRDALDPKLHTF